MNCEQTQRMLHPYLDNELDADTLIKLDMHLAGCDACRAELHKYQQLQSSLHSNVKAFTLPDGARDRFLQRIRQEETRQAAQLEPFWKRVQTGYAVAAMILLAWIITVLVPGKPADMSLAVIDAHVRSLQANHLTDVQSTDQHTVKPWFNGKIAISPEVKDFTQQGFKLVGGRLDYLAQHPAAVVVYQRRKHIINLFCWQSDKPVVLTGQQQGFNMIAWRENGLQYWLVSDLNNKELGELADLIQRKKK